MDRGLFLRVSRRTLSLNFALDSSLIRIIPLRIRNPRNVTSFTKATRLFCLFTGRVNSHSRYPLIPCMTRFAALSDLSNIRKSSAHRQYRRPLFSSSWSSSFRTMFESIGDSGEPWGHPLPDLMIFPSTRTPAFNALAISVTSPSSAICRRMSLKISSWGISSKKLAKSMDAHHSWPCFILGHYYQGSSALSHQYCP